jgi:hypothetical protein
VKTDGGIALGWVSELRDKMGKWSDDPSGDADQQPAFRSARVRELAGRYPGAAQHLNTAADAIDKGDYGTARTHLVAAYTTMGNRTRPGGVRFSEANQAAVADMNAMRQHIVWAGSHDYAGRWPAVELSAVPQRAASRRKLAAKGQALPSQGGSPPSFPIPNVDYLRRAIKSVGRAPASKRPALATLIRKRARELKATKAPGVKGTWAFQGASTSGWVLELTGPGGWSHGWRRDGGTWVAKAPAPSGGPQLSTSKDGEALRRGDRVAVVGGQHAGKTGTVIGAAGTAPGLLAVRAGGGSMAGSGENIMVHGKHVKRTGGAALAGTASAISLAFDPSQPRDLHGKWAHTPSWKPEHAREAAVPAAQRASGIWGGRTASEHQAEVAKLTPAQRSVYNRLQANGMSLPAALKYAKRGRMPAAPRPPAGMDTPNMRRAIAYGLLGADNRLGGISRARSSSAMNYASTTHGKVVDLAMAMTRRMPVVNGAADVQLSRSGPGKVTVMHKSSGVKVGTLAQAGKGWQGVHASGAKTPPSGTMGGAVAGLVAAHNQLARGKRLPAAQKDGTASYAHDAGDGINLAGSLPVTSSSDGPRVTTAGGSGSGPGGLTGEAASIYARLIKKGLKPGQAAALARRAAAMHAKAAA